ncbi:MAG: hypothetical protein KGJ43_01215 [Acidobacteriota bacterium]|nr:hypothetical protein [Acidobacteriota bacterium]
MGLLDRAKAAADQASTRVKEGVDEVQAKRSLAQAYDQLGQTTYELISKGEISHPDLSAQADQIRVLREHHAGDGAAAPAGQEDAVAPATPAVSEEPQPPISA